MKNRLLVMCISILSLCYAEVPVDSAADSGATFSDSSSKQSGKISYAGFSVMEAQPLTPEDLAWLESSPCSMLGEWAGNGVGLLCSCQQANHLKKAARRRGLQVKIATRHLGQKIRESEGLGRDVARADLQATANLQEQERILNHKNYVDTQTIFRFLDLLAEENGNINITTIGRTSERRDIKLVTVNGDRGLPKIFIDAGIHAREWISPAATLFFLERLVRLVKRKEGRHAVLGKFEWQIIPLANPDGYEYTRRNDRMWRKNRRKLPNSECIGVDLNRNFPEGYSIGASTSPCSEVYQGPEPLSEPESLAIQNHVSNTEGISAAVSVHSYGNVLIFPWGYQEIPHPQKETLSKMALAISDDIRERTRENYRPGTAREVFGVWGLAGGATDDYYITKGIPYSFTLELPGDDKGGSHGFLLPPSNIKRVGTQLVAAMTSLASNL